MNKATLRGASKTQSRPPFIPKRHLLLVGSIAACVFGVMAFLPSSDVEAKRTEVPLLINAHQASPIDELSTANASSVTAHVEQPAETSPLPDKTPISPVEQAKRELAQAASATAKQTNTTEPSALPLTAEDPLGQWSSHTVQSGDNLSTLFEAQGLGPSVVYQITRAPDYGKALTRIRPGETLEFRINDQGELTQLRYVQSQLESIFYKKHENGYLGESIILSPELKPAYAEGTIKNSLFLASQRAGLSQGLTMKLAGIFGWDIDFVQDIRSGDHFSVLYEERYLDGEKLGDGEILAAHFTSQGKTYTAIRYTDSDGDTNYYTPEGKSMKKAFLRTPVDFTRISSRFNPNRLHPVFKTKRPHRGVDYAAPTNTPIKAAGDGRIQFAGWQNGFGNVVYIEHPNNIVTVYAHANKLPRGLKKGQRVKQGQTVAYVGQTGWATGPHLHFEFRVNGVHRNPLTVKLPDAQPIAKKELANFKKLANLMVARLEKHSSTLLAEANE